MSIQQLKELAKLADSEVTWILLPKDLANEGWCTEVVNYISVVSPSTVTALVDRIEAAERERDELRKMLTATQGGTAEAINHSIHLQAEIARRDVAAGEPVGYFVKTLDENGAGFSFMSNDSGNFPGSFPLYTAAPPAVLPPEKPVVFGSDLCQDIENYGYNLALADTRKLGAQQQKAVELPNECSERYAWSDGTYNLLHDVKAALDAANVKWEVKN